MITVLAVCGCENDSTISENSSIGNEKSELSNNLQREIVDLRGNVVKVPSAENLNRVLIISPPISSIYYSVLKDTNRIIAVHPLTFKNANSEIAKKVFKKPNDIDSSFIKDFNINIESILNLKPDIIFYYGQQQKKGMENLNIPMIDFMKPQERNPLTVTIEWERLMREVFEVKYGKTIKEEWDRVNEKLEASLEKIEGEKLKGLMIFNNSSNKVIVSGNNTYGDYWLEMSGLINTADSINGEKEVSMEDIYQWNPDVIYIFMGEPASNYLKGIRGQDWSRVKAIKENRIYDVPKGIFSWGAPNSDSPLMVEWMATKNYPSYFNEEKFNNIVKEYYKNHYNIILTDEVLSSILQPNREGEQQ